MRRSSLEVNTTCGMLLARIVPSFGMLSVQAHRSSNNILQTRGLLCPSSSISKTHGFSYSSELKGPALKNRRPCKAVLSDSQSTLSDFAFSSTQSLSSDWSNFPKAFSWWMPS